MMVSRHPPRQTRKHDVVNVRDLAAHGPGQLGEERRFFSSSKRELGRPCWARRLEATSGWDAVWSCGGLGLVL